MSPSKGGRLGANRFGAAPAQVREEEEEVARERTGPPPGAHSRHEQVDEVHPQAAAQVWRAFECHNKS